MSPTPRVLHSSRVPRPAATRASGGARSGRSRDDDRARRARARARRCAAGSRAAKLLCVILAPNIEQGTASGGLDENVAEIIKLARGAEFPVVFALNMRKLGRALGKAIKVSAVALYNARTARTKELRAVLRRHQEIARRRPTKRGVETWRKPVRIRCAEHCPGATSELAPCICTTGTRGGHGRAASTSAARNEQHDGRRLVALLVAPARFWAVETGGHSV